MYKCSKYEVNPSRDGGDMGDTKGAKKAAQLRMDNTPMMTDSSTTTEPNPTNPALMGRARAGE